MAVDGESAYIGPDLLLRMLINIGEREVKLLKQDKFKLITSLFALYEAFACIEDKDDLDLDVLRKVTDKANIQYHKGLMDNYEMTKARKRKLRRIALSPDPEKEKEVING